MYNGSTEFDNLISTPGGNSVITRLTFADFSISKFTKLEYYGGSNNSDDIAIGTTNMAYLDVSTITDKIITNQEFLFEVGMELSDGTIEYAPMGYFTVQKPDGDEDSINFTAYDRMQKFEKPYFSALTYPTNSAEVLNELCAMCGVELATPIANPIAISEKLEGYTCREVLGYIAGIHGYFACIDRYGKLNLRWYSATPIEKQIGLIWSLTKAQSNYTVEKITLAKDSETTYTSGTGISGINYSNPYATQAIADSIYASLGGFTYRPCEISMLDDIRLDPWDMIKVTYLDGSVLTIPVMSLSHSFTNGETKIKSVGKNDTENEYSYSGPVTQAMERMSTELLVANRVIATKVDAEWVNAHTVTADKLEATNARVENLETYSLTAEEADLRYADITLANIDTANIDVANIGLLFAKVGLIDRATIVDGHITGYLDAVEINANNITAGTLTVDRLIMLDKYGNAKLATLDEHGALVTSTINGSIITERSINASHIVANSITANEIAAETITGKNILSNSITADKIDVNNLVSLSANIGGFSFYQGNMEYVENDRVGYNDLSGFLEFNYISTTLKAVSYTSATDKLFYIGAHPEQYTTDMVGSDGWVKEDYMTYPFYVTAKGHLHSEEGDIAGFTFSKDGFSSSLVTSGKVTQKFVLNCDVPYGEPNGLPFMGLQNASGKFGSFYVTTNGLGHFANLDVDEDIIALGDVYADYYGTEISLLGLASTKQNTIIGAASTITSSNLTANRALVSNASGKVDVSAITSTELGYLSGVTSAIQTQINNKLPISGGTLTGQLIIISGRADKISPDNQDIRIDGIVGDTTVSGAPGIGFHQPNIGWASIKYFDDAFKFINWQYTGFTSIVAHNGTFTGEVAEENQALRTRYAAKNHTHAVSGGTADSGYIRFTDFKIQIAWKRVTDTPIPILYPWGNLYLAGGSTDAHPTSMGNWPVAFSDIPKVFYGVRSDIGTVGVMPETSGPVSSTFAGYVIAWRGAKDMETRVRTFWAVGIGPYA